MVSIGVRRNIELSKQTQTIGTGWRSTTRRLLRVPAVPTLMLVATIVAAVFADVIAPQDPYKPNLTMRMQPPAWETGGNWSYPLGTDLLGRDILSRIIYGARISLVMVFLTLSVGGAMGALLGLASGYYGGRIDIVIMRAADAMLALPVIFVVLILVVGLGPGFLNIVIALSTVLWARYARLIRGDVLTIMHREFIDAARMTGCPSSRIMFRHVLPNVANTLIVALTLQVGWVILVEASLSFLGAGVPPPIPSWGGMVAEGREQVTRAWWISMMPGLAILLVCISFNLVGDWLRDTWDPKLRNV